MATSWKGGEPPVAGADSFEEILEAVGMWTQCTAGWTAWESENYAAKRNGELVHGGNAPIHRVMGSDRFPHIKSDYRNYQWELCPLRADNWLTAADVRRGSIELYTEMMAAAEEHGVLLLGVADASCWNAKFPGRDVVPDTERYNRLIDALPAIRIGATKVGFQSHRANDCELDDDYFAARLGIEQTLPLLLAPGCSSYQPQSLVMSRRYFNFSSLSSTGLFGWHTKANYLRTLKTMWEDNKRIHGPEDIHPWVKPCVSSTEVRICDTPQSVIHAIVLHAVSYCLMEYYFLLVKSGEDIHRMELPWQTERIEHALALAATWGTTRPDLKLPNPFGPGCASFEQLYRDLDSRIGPIMTELGYSIERHYFFNEMVANRQNGAEWQRIWREVEGLRTREFLQRSHDTLKASIAEAEELFSSTQLSLEV